MYQPIYFCNPPRKYNCQIDYFLQKCIFCLSSYLALYSVILKTEAGTGKRSTSSPQALLRFLRGGILVLHSRHTFHLGGAPSAGSPREWESTHIPLPPVWSSLCWAAFPSVVWFREVGVLLLQKTMFARCFQFSLFPLDNVQVEKVGNNNLLPDFSSNYWQKGFDVTLILGRNEEHLNYIKKGTTYFGNNKDLVQRLIIDVRVTELIVAWVMKLIVTFDKIRDTILRRKIQLRTCAFIQKCKCYFKSYL